MGWAFHKRPHRRTLLASRQCQTIGTPADTSRTDLHRLECPSPCPLPRRRGRGFQRGFERMGFLGNQIAKWFKEACLPRAASMARRLELQAWHDAQSCKQALNAPSNRGICTSGKMMSASPACLRFQSREPDRFNPARLELLGKTHVAGKDQHLLPCRGKINERINSST